MISAPCKMFVLQISPRIFLKMSIFSLHVQNHFFRRTLMILKLDTRLGSDVNFLSTEGGKVNSCTAADGNNIFSTYQITGSPSSLF